jgi:AmmeMemoRadiSam system protein B
MYLRDYSWAAGGFYPTDAKQAARMIEECMADPLPALRGEPLLIAGIVPHAGWVFSGKTAGKVFKALLRRKKPPETAICFGSVHVAGVRKPAIIREGAWRTPFGDLPIDSALSGLILDKFKADIVENNSPHEEEHSLEVVFPFLKKIFPDVRIVPIMAPPDERAAKIGDRIGEAVIANGEDVIFIGSSDLTHYGSRFGFTPVGIGSKAVEWVKEKNDRRLIDLVLNMRASEVVKEARENQSACGPGAIAATVAAASALGAKQGFLLEQTTSYDVQPSGGADTFVGYAGIVF